MTILRGNKTPKLEEAHVWTKITSEWKRFWGYESVVRKEAKKNWKVNISYQQGASTAIIRTSKVSMLSMEQFMWVRTRHVEETSAGLWW